MKTDTTLPLAKTDAGNEQVDPRSLAQRLTDIADQIFQRWDSDMRSGKLLTALAGRIENYNRDVTAIRGALASHDALVKVLEEIAATNIERETVTPVNSFRAFGQANSELIRLRDIARAALSRAKEQGGE